MLEAFPLCPGSLPVIGTACNTVSGAAGTVAGAGIGAVFSQAVGWVASGAVWLIAEVGRAMSATTSIDLNARWFSSHEAVMTSLAAAVVLPMACCAAIQAVYRQSASTLLRIFFVHLPLSLLLTGVAVTLVRMALAVTDAMSARVLSSAGVDTGNLFSGIVVFLGPAALAAGPGVPGFVVFIGALLVAMAALVLWLELVVRAAAVSVAVLFLPLSMAALVWPSVAHWCRRLVETLVALVLSKLVVAAVLSLAAGAIAGGLGLSGGGDGGGFASVVTGIALLIVATMSPFTLLRLIPAVEAGAIAHLESTRHRLQGAARTPLRSGGNLALDHVRAQGSPESEGADVGSGTSTIPMISGTALGPEVAVAAGATKVAGATGVPGTGSGEARSASVAPSATSAPTASSARMAPTASSTGSMAPTASSDSGGGDLREGTGRGEE